MRQRYYIFIALGLMLLGVTLPKCAVAQYYPERKLVRDGNEQFKTRNFANSLKKYQHAYDEDSTKYEVLYNRANAYYQKLANTPTAEDMTLEEAYARYERIAADTLLSDKQRAEVYRNLGESLFEQEQYEAALNTFRESLRLNPADKATKYNYMLTKRIVDQKRAAEQQQQNQNQDQNQNGGGGEDNQNNENSDQNQDDNNGGNDNQQGDDNQQSQNDQNDDKGNDKNKPEDKDGDGKPDEQQGNGDKPEDRDGDGKPDPKDGEGDKEQEQNGAPQPKALSPEQERMLDAIQAEEDKTQDKLGEKKKAVIIPGKKNW